MDVAVGWLLLVAAVWLWRSHPERTRVSAVLAATAIAWLVGGALHRGPLAHLLLSWPTGRVRGRGTRLIVALAYLDGIVESVVRLDGAAFAYAAILAGAGVVRVASASGIVQRGRLVAGAGAVLIAGVLGLGRASILAGIAGSGEAALIVYAIAVALTAVALIVDLHWGAWSRSAVTGLVVELGSRDDAASLRARLAAATGDPSLTVGYAVPGGGFIDDTGGLVDLPAPGSGRVATPVHDGTEVVALIVHDAAVLDDPAIVRPAAAAARLAVANMTLRRQIDGRRTAIDASKLRLVAAADSERQRIERRLADGALARLDRVRTLVEDPALAAAIADAPIDLGRETAAAERELRAFARGVYPRSLREAGLTAAVAELASSVRSRITVEIPPERLSPDIESAAYFVCSEALANALKHAAASQVSIRASLDPERLRVSVADDGPGGADPDGSGLAGLRDRVEAVGGTLIVRSPVGQGTLVEAVLPRSAADAGHRQRP